MVVLFDQLSLIVLVYLNSLVLKVPDDFFGVTNVETQTKKLDNVLKLRPYGEHILSQSLTQLDQQIVLFTEEHQQKLQATNLGVLVNCVDLLVLDLLHHFVVHLFQFL